VQAGQPGNFEAAAYVNKLEVPTRLDRAEGDVHAAGNPHIQTDPRTSFPSPKRWRDVLQRSTDERRVLPGAPRRFRQTLDAAIERWQAQGAPLRGTPIVIQHKGFPYLEQWLGLVEVATARTKPGVEPTTGSLTEVLAQLQQKPRR